MNDMPNYTSNMITIITNAICGKTTQPCQTTVFIAAKGNVEPAQVLGCTITNAKIHESIFEDFSNNNINVRINGEFEIHVWYETNGDTTVSKSNEKFSEVISVPTFEGVNAYRGEHLNQNILAWINKDPTSLGTMIVNKCGIPAVAIQVEYELGVEVVGEAKVNILSLKSDDKEKTLNSYSNDDVYFDNVNYDDVD